MQATKNERTSANISRSARVFSAAALIVAMTLPLAATPASAAQTGDWGGFWKCWWARDLEGNGTSFTGGCWDKHMSIKIPDTVERQLKSFQSSYAKDKQALRTRYMEQGKKIK